MVTDGSRFCLLRKALYGLKQAPRVWYERLSMFLIEIGFHPTSPDHSVFVAVDLVGVVLVAIYVEDLVIFSKGERQMTELKGISAEFDMKDLREICHCLGLKITRNRERRTIRLSQAHAIQKLLEKFNTGSCKQNKTMLPAGLNLKRL